MQPQIKTSKNSKIITIDEAKLGTDYRQLGKGDEGTVYNYNNKYAIKTFDLFLETKQLDKLKQKYNKIEAMQKLNDESFCFPQGIVLGSNNNRLGCFMNLIEPDQQEINFSYLFHMNNRNDVFRHLIDADIAIQRIHKKDVRIGDVRDTNILIDQNHNIKFIDTDNYAYEDFGFDLPSWRIRAIKEKYGSYLSNQDTDIILFSIMELRNILKDPKCTCSTDTEYFYKKIKKLPISKNAKNDLIWIFSNSCERPYIGDVLTEMKNNSDVFVTQKKLEIK